MKTILRYPFYAYLFFFLGGALSGSISGKAQDKISPRLDVAYYQTDSAVRYLSLKVRQRVQKRFEPIAGAVVNVFLELPDETVKIGNVVSNAKGEGKILIGAKVLAAMHRLDEYSFYAEIPETDSLEEVTEYLVIKPSRLTLKTDDLDKSISVYLEAKTNGNWNPVEGAEVAVFIQRRFGKILVGESSMTDENGAVELAFDTKIPGDANGLLTLESAVEDHDEIGNVYATITTRWGLPMVASDQFMRRTLWGTRDRTPLWLLIFPNAMIAGVWGVIIYLIVLVFKMIRLSHKAT
ncbi:MAG TPA: hypothetical protein VIQ51_01615 [Chryseosolibacter sp.]